MSEKKSFSRDRLVLGAQPRADLLPPELKAEERLRAQRRGLIGVAVLAVALVAAGYVYAVFSAQSAASNLAAANAQTQQLIDEKNKYIEVRELSDQLKTIKFLQVAGVGVEIDWKQYLDLVRKSLPAGTVITTVSAELTSPDDTEQTAPLKTSHVAQITFIATTPTLPKVSAWVDSLSQIVGFADATPGSIALVDGGGYSVTIIMHINADALAHRFTGDDLNGNGVPDSTEPADTTDTSGETN